MGGIYRIEAQLGSGSMGVVYSARDEVLERRVAIKLIRPPSSVRNRFLLEARAMALVSHPNVVAIHAIGEHEHTPFIVMELVEGQTLERWLAPRRVHPDLDAALLILNQVCLGVEAIHQAGTLHRDLKPGNVLLDHDLRARVSDLGLAVSYLDGSMVRELVGTPGYIAPEIQFDRSAKGCATPQSDLYSLACVAYELLTGRPPFNAETPRELAVLHAIALVPPPSSVRPALPKTFDEVLLQALRKVPSERMASVELFRRALLRARSDSLEPSRILVAEDDPDFRELLELALTRAFPAACVECVGDGRSAVDAFDRHPASVVMLDLRMPGLDGQGATELLRTRDSASGVPIIIMTASGGAQEWALLADSGADRFLVKPVNWGDLISIIRCSVRERSSRSPRLRVRAQRTAR